MKKILIPTDFSPCAQNAVKASFLFAEKFTAEIFLIHVINEKISPDQNLNDFEQLNKHVEEQLQKISLLAKEKNIKCSYSIKTGKFLTVLNEEVKIRKPDFIIMGSHGASGKKEFFIGSNAQKAIRSIHLPFFIVKEALENIDFDKVVFASGFNEADKRPFKYFLSFIQPFNPEIHLVAINTYNWFSQPYMVLKDVIKEFEEMAKGFVVMSHFYSDLSVDAGIRHFSNTIGADLIVISNLERHPIKRILSGSSVEALVNHSNLPVLSIDYPS